MFVRLLVSSVFALSLVLFACTSESPRTTQTAAPAAPEVAVAPESVAEPKVPDAPVLADAADVPAVPDTPADPVVPDAPDVPDVADVPAVPDTPVDPVVPNDPEVAEVAEVPEAAEVPAVPEFAADTVEMHRIDSMDPLSEEQQQLLTNTKRILIVGTVLCLLNLFLQFGGRMG